MDSCVKFFQSDGAFCENNESHRLFSQKAIKLDI